MFYGSFEDRHEKIMNLKVNKKKLVLLLCSEYSESPLTPYHYNFGFINDAYLLYLCECVLYMYFYLYYNYPFNFNAALYCNKYNNLKKNIYYTVKVFFLLNM